MKQTKLQMGVPSNAGRAFAFFNDRFLLRSTPQKSEPYRAAIPYAVGRRISFGATSSPLRKRVKRLASGPQVVPYARKIPQNYKKYKFFSLNLHKFYIFFLLYI